jgi:hypothetical protein
LRHRSPKHRDGKPSVLITILPVRLDVADYDQAFRLHDTLEYDFDDDRRDGQEIWQHDWGVGDDMRLDDLREDQRAAERKTGGYEMLDENLVALLGQQREREISELQAKLLLHRRPQPEDRPGTRDEWDRRSDLPQASRPAPRPADLDGALRHARRVLASASPEARGDAAWRQTILTEMEKHRARGQLLPAALDTELSPTDALPTPVA